jgi:hypothetical protein
MTLRCQTSVVLATTLLACSEPTVSDRGVDVVLTVDRAVLSEGDTADVVVVATNRGARPVTINSGGCPPAFVVLDAVGSVAVPGPEICSAVLSTRQLGPGESYAFRHVWRLDAARDRAPTPQPLTPGIYVLRGRVVGQHLRAESSPVTIEIESPLPAN